MESGSGPRGGPSASLRISAGGSNAAERLKFKSSLPDQAFPVASFQTASAASALEIAIRLSNALRGLNRPLRYDFFSKEIVPAGHHLTINVTGMLTGGTLELELVAVTVIVKVPAGVPGGGGGGV